MAEEAAPLTPRMKRTMARARELARERGHDDLGTEHVLLALIDDPNGIAGGAMHRLGYADRLRDEVIGIIESVGYAKPAPPRKKGLREPE